MKSLSLIALALAAVASVVSARALSEAQQPISQQVNQTLTVQQIFVEGLTFGEIITVGINPADSVALLKNKIEQQNGIPWDNQRLIFASKVLADWRQLSDYGILSGSTVKLVLRLRGGLEKQILMFANEQLEEANQSSTGIDVQPRSTHHLVLRAHGLIGTEDVSVNTYAVKNINVEYNPQDTVAQLKDKITVKEGIPRDQQRVLFNNRICDDEKTLAE